MPNVTLTMCCSSRGGRQGRYASIHNVEAVDGAIDEFTDATVVSTDDEFPGHLPDLLDGGREAAMQEPTASLCARGKNVPGRADSAASWSSLSGADS